MNIFTIDANTIPRLQKQATRLEVECKTKIAEETCGGDCGFCWISNWLPRYGKAVVDRYTAVTVGARGGVAAIRVNFEGVVVLEGTNGRFVATVNPRGGVKLTPYEA